MALRVKVRRGGPDVPEDFVFSVLSSILRMKREEYEKIKEEDGSVSIYVKDPEAIVRLQEVGEKYPELIDISFERVSQGGLFSITNKAVKSNIGLALSWSAILFLLLLLSVVPLIGIVFNQLTSIFLYAFLIMIAFELKETDLESRIEEKFSSIKVGRAFSDYLGAGVGMWLGFLLLYLLLIVIFFFLALSFGLIGTLSDLSVHGEVKGGAVSSLVVIAILFFTLGLWLFYVIPLILAKAIGTGTANFESAFKAVLSVLRPSFIKESFSSEYISTGAMWSLVATIGIFGFVLTLALIVTIPIAFLILYWLNIYLSLSAVFYIKKL